MAIAGSGGWIPSSGLVIRAGKLLPVGYTQNKPRNIVLPLDEAAEALRSNPRAIVQIDVRDGGIWQLRKALYESGHIQSMEAA